MCRNWIHTFFWGNQSAEKSLPLFFQMSEASTFHFLYSHDSRCCTLFWFSRGCVVANWARGSFMSFLFRRAWAPILPLGFACFAPQAPICVPLIVPCAAMRATWFWSATHHNTWGWSGQRGLLQQIMMMTIVSIIEGGQLMITLTTPTTFTIRRKGECTWRCFGCWDADLHYSDRKNMQNFGLRHLHSPHPLESYFSKYCKTILPLTSHCCFGDKWKLDGKLLDYRKTGHARHIFGP